MLHQLHTHLLPSRCTAKLTIFQNNIDLIYQILKRVKNQLT